MRFLPHELSNAVKNVAPVEEGVDLGEIKTAPELVELLRHVLPALQRDLVLGAVKKCTAHLDRLRAAATRHQSGPLIGWVKEVTASAQRFDTTACENAVVELIQMVELPEGDRDAQ
jgi:hypothetical protein